jgi:hypothetical protein
VSADGCKVVVNLHGAVVDSCRCCFALLFRSEFHDPAQFVRGCTNEVLASFAVTSNFNFQDTNAR